MPFAAKSKFRRIEAVPGGITETGRPVLRAFTLIELLVVMAIISVLAVVVVPPLGSVLRSRQISQATETVVSALNLARQTALTQNRVVEVRFYRYADSSNPGENINNPSSGKYRAMQLFKQTESGTGSAAIGAVVHLPPSTILDSGTPLSSLFNLPEQAGTAAAYPLPGLQTNYKFVSFHFRPDGSTDLTPASSLWYLTLHNLIYGDALAKPPVDYSTVQLDALNGKVISYRP